MSKKGSKLRDLNDFSIEEMEELARQVRAKTPVGLLSAMEQAVEDAKARFGNTALEEMLARVKPETTSPKPCPKCGKKVGIRGKARPRTVRTLSGEMTYSRHYHYCRGCKLGFYPRDQELDVPAEGDLSREVEKRVLDFAVTTPFGRCEERWSVHYSTTLSRNSFARVAERIGKKCEASHDAALDQTTQAAAREAAKLLIVQNDGSHLPIRGAEAWKECKLAVIVRGDAYAPGSEQKRGMIGEARYVGVLGKQAEFKKRLDTALRMSRCGQAATVVWVGDGALGNWTLANSLAPHAIQILDVYHAIEHAMDCAKGLYGEHSAKLRPWKETVTQKLFAGDIDGLLQSLQQQRTRFHPHKRRHLSKLMKYYESNRHRMNYRDYRERGFPVGSGIVESAHRHVLQDRMKRAGQRWSLPRARRMARLRCGMQTAGPQRLYQAILEAERLTLTGQIPLVGHVKRRASRSSRGNRKLHAVA